MAQEIGTSNKKVETLVVKSPNGIVIGYLNIMTEEAAKRFRNDAKSTFSACTVEVMNNQPKAEW